MSKWLTSKEYREKYGISSAVLWARANTGHTIQTKEMYNKTYYLDESEELNDLERQNVIYSRVDNKEHFEQLNDVIKIISEYCLKTGEKPDIILKEVRNGNDLQAKEFKKLIDMIVCRKVKNLYIACEDVLSANCYDFIKYICNCCGTEIVSLNYNF